MIVLLFFIIVAIILLLFFYFQSQRLHKRFLENFSEDLYYDISPEDKQLYFSIIDTFQLLLERDPSEDELNYEFTEIKLQRSDAIQLYNKLKNTIEYKRLNNNTDSLPYATASVDTDYDDVKNIVHKLMPLTDPSREDPLYFDYLVMKYSSLQKNEDKFIDYIKKTPEYLDYKSLFDKQESVVEKELQQEPVDNNNPIMSCSSNLINERDNIQPDLLANYTNNRNMDAIQYHCNLHDSVIDFTKTEPITSNKECSNQFGTLLSDLTNSDKILPTLK